MATPLYRSMKEKGSTFYAFPSSSMHKNPKFSKFVLLHIPNKIENTSTITGRFDFDKDTLNGYPVKIYTDAPESANPKYSDQMIESLRNYVANHDTTMRDSKVNTTNGFYNIEEKQTASEIIFWKWIKKLNAIGFEPAEHKIDWDKNLPYYSNPNADTVSNTDYFRKYLWKERETKNYTMETLTYIGVVAGVSNNTVNIFISYPAKYKVGDTVVFDGDDAIFYDPTLTPVDGKLAKNTPYKILKVDENTDNTRNIYIDGGKVIDNVTDTTGYVTLDYHRMVQYIGEVNAISDVRTSTKDETEVIAYIPHQAGKTPSVLFTTRTDTNYYPGLELPILPEQIQTEIRGAEKLESPIRQYPGNYPGSYYGQFDTAGKTYLASDGDKVRYSGEYYGVLRNNNVGLSDETYVELLSEFQDKNLDGLNIDFDLNHYLKMTLTDEQVGFNFDEFNQIVIDGERPTDFDYNAILWYYEIEGDTVNDKNIYTNLYGITFLNNPDNDDDLLPEYITPYHKLVNSDEHDGLSYKHVLNISTSVDNDTSTLSFDPLTVNNTFGFDLYQNVMNNVAKLMESFSNIINEFIRMNDELNAIKSVVYSQTDIDVIKNKINNLEDLLKLYKQYQFVETDSVSIVTNYSGNYPTLAFNIKNVDYTNLYNLKITDIYNYKVTNNKSYLIEVPDSNKLFTRITNNDTTNYGELSIVLSKDLKYKQVIDLYIDADGAYYSNVFHVKLQQIDSSTGVVSEVDMIENIFLPTDIANNTPGAITYNKAYYNDTQISQTVYSIATSGDTLNTFDLTAIYTTGKNLFGNSTYIEKVFIDNFKVIDSLGNIKDFTGVYDISIVESHHQTDYFLIELDSIGYTIISSPVVRLIKGYRIKIVRINTDNYASMKEKYFIEKSYI